MAGGKVSERHVSIFLALFHGCGECDSWVIYLNFHVPERFVGHLESFHQLGDLLQRIEQDE